MVRVRSSDEIILNMIDLLRVLQPDLDTKQGTVARDLFVEMPAAQLSFIYDQVGDASNLQSLRLTSGTDLDNLLANFGLSRKVPAKASGLALFTFNMLPAPIAINSGDLVFASNGSTFVVANGLSVIPSNSNSYRSIATKFKNELDFLGITDQFAVEVTLQASTPGSAGNISKYGLTQTSTSGISNVTNVYPFTGGSDQEDDPSFRNRGLAIFSGSNTGTSLGYRNTALTDSNVLDVLVIEPGDPLMSRDGTISVLNTDGTYTIISEGTGGKVDLIILGTRLAENTDSFIYQDKSNNNDPTDPKNIFTLGQILGDTNKNVNRRRVENIAAGTLPAQPVEELLEVTGSRSGANFLPKNVDDFGRVTGNYELIKDTGAFQGSPFGFDKFHWIDNQIEFEEDRIKSKFNGQDNVTFTDVLQIPQVQQSVAINNENSSVISSDKSLIQLLHVPASNVTRVFNVNTGERYTVTNQNVDGTGSANITGRIRITGNTLPSVNDILQVDYTWVVNFDPCVDYDGKIIKSNPRVSDDSIDWGLSNVVRNELATFALNTDSAFYTGTVTHPISVVLSAALFKSSNSILTTVTSGNFSGRLSLLFSQLSEEVTSVDGVTLQNSTLEIYNTNDADGTFITQRIIVGSTIKFNCTIILPSDTPAVAGEHATAYFNQTDAFTLGTSVGNFTANQITIPATNLEVTDAYINLRVNYLSNIQDALTIGSIALPASRVGNSFNENTGTGFINTAVSNIIRRENQTVQLNALSAASLTLSVNSNDFNLLSSGILSVVDLNNHQELWNAENPGTLGTNVQNFYTLTLTSFGSPQIGDNVAVFYVTDDVKRTQPFTFNSTLVNKNIQSLQFDPTTKIFTIPIQSFTDDSVTFSIIDPTNQLVVATGGAVITANSLQATVTPDSYNLSLLDELLLKQIKIENSSFSNNNGIYDIVSFNSMGNSLIIGNELSNFSSNQISVVRLLDNKEIWNDHGIINLEDNELILPATIAANDGDYVITFFFVANNLRQSPSRLSVTVADQINNSGILTLAGTTMTKMNDLVFTATTNGLKQNIAEAVRNSLKLTSSTSISSNILFSRLATLKKVTTSSTGDILSTDATYDVIGTLIKDNALYANEMVDSDLLSNLEFTLPGTNNNIVNAPKIGDRLQITGYYSTVNDTESLSFTRNGTLYTNKLFALIDKIYVSSGFNSSSIRFILSYFNQPTTGSRYKSFYNYIAPKQNERIVIRYNYNKLIGDTTFNIESARPINADVLVKAAREILVDLTVNVVIKSTFLASADTVLQNLKNKLTTAINTNTLGDTLDGSDLISVAQSVDGIDRARIIYFNEDGKTGQVLSLVAQKDQFFTANTVLAAAETR